MSGNVFGKFFKIMSWGESHGKAVGVVIDGVIPGISLSVEDIQRDLDRRRPGQSAYVSPRKEEDKVQILSGVFNGKTIGTPLCLLVWNKDFNSEDYQEIKDFFRPGHADYTYYKKYSFYDYRGGGRSSGRETLARVAAGVIAKKILDKSGIKIYAYTHSIGDLEIKCKDYTFIEQNPLRVPDKDVLELMLKKIDQIKAENDSIGGIVGIDVFNMPIGLGDPVFDKLEANLSKGLMSIGAVKGVELGSGFRHAQMKGSESNDSWDSDSNETKVSTETNHSGGIMGGISNGMPLKIRIAVKAPSSINREQNFLNKFKSEVNVFKMQKGRHDPCILPRIVPVAEAMVALVLCDHFLIQKIYSS